MSCIERRRSLTPAWKVDADGLACSKTASLARRSFWSGREERGATYVPLHLLVYLANTIAAGDKEIPYSVVAALDPSLKPPLGPFLPPGVKQLADDEIVLADWKDSPLPRRRSARRSRCPSSRPPIKTN